MHIFAYGPYSVRQKRPKIFFAHNENRRTFFCGSILNLIQQRSEVNGWRTDGEPRGCNVFKKFQVLMGHILVILGGVY